MQNVTLEMRKRIAEQLDELLLNTGVKPSQLLDTVQEEGVRLVLASMLPDLEQTLKAERIPSAFLRDSQEYLENHLTKKVYEMATAEQRNVDDLIQKTLDGREYSEAVKIMEQLKEYPYALETIGTETTSTAIAFEAIEMLSTANEIEQIARIGLHSKNSAIRMLAQTELSGSTKALLTILKETEDETDRNRILGMINDNEKLRLALNAKTELHLREMLLENITDSSVLKQSIAESMELTNMGILTNSQKLAGNIITILASNDKTDELVRIGVENEVLEIRQNAQDRLRGNPEALVRVLEGPNSAMDKPYVLGMFDDDGKLGVVLNSSVGLETREMFLGDIADPNYLKIITLTNDIGSIPSIACKRLEAEFPDALLDDTFNMSVLKSNDVPKEFIKRSVDRITNPELLKSIVLDPGDYLQMNGEGVTSEAIRILAQKYPDALNDEQFSISVHSARKNLPTGFVEKTLDRITSPEGRAELVLDTELPREFRTEQLKGIIAKAKENRDPNVIEILKSIVYTLEDRNAMRDKRNTSVDPVLSYARGSGIQFGIRWSHKDAGLDRLENEVKRELQTESAVDSNEIKAPQEDADYVQNLPVLNANNVLAEKYNKISLEQLKGMMSDVLGTSIEEIEQMHPVTALKKAETLAGILNKQLKTELAEDKKAGLSENEARTDVDVDKSIAVLERKQKIKAMVKTLETLAQGEVNIEDAVDALTIVAKEHEKYDVRLQAMNALKQQVKTTGILCEELEQFAIKTYLDINDREGLPRIALEILTEVMEDDDLARIRKERTDKSTKEPVTGKQSAEFNMPWEERVAPVKTTASGRTEAPVKTDPISLEKKMIDRLYKLSEKRLENYATNRPREAVCLAAVEGINNARRLARIAKEAKFESVRKAAEKRCKEITEENTARRKQRIRRLINIVEGAAAAVAIILASLTINGHAEDPYRFNNPNQNKPKLEYAEQVKAEAVDAEITVSTKKVEKIAKKAEPTIEQKVKTVAPPELEEIKVAQPEQKEVKVVQPKPEEVKVVPEIKTVPEPSKELADDAIGYEEQKPFQDNVEKAVVADAPQPTVDTATQTEKGFKLTEMLQDTPELPVNQEEVALLRLQRTIEGSLDSGNYDNLDVLFQFKAKTGHQGKWIGWEDGKEDKSVSNLQLLLRNIGHNEVQLTGQYDKDTENAVKNLQKTMLREGITLEFGADGKFGKETWNGLQQQLKNQKNDAKSMLADYMGFKGKFASSAKPGPSMQLNRI